MDNNRMTNRSHKNMMPMWNMNGPLKPFDTENMTSINISPFDVNHYVPQTENGRVTYLNKSKGNLGGLYKDNNDKNDSFKTIALTGTNDRTPLTDLFFSRANMNIIQNQIRYSVYLASNKKHVIDKQDDTELQIIMRAIYLQHSLNLPDQIKEQIISLNQQVVNFAYPKILSEIEQFIHYKNNIQYLPQTIDLPKNVSSKGTRSLSSVYSSF